MWVEVNPNMHQDGTYGGLRILHCINKGLNLITGASDNLRPSKLELPCLSTLVHNGKALREFVERQLLDYLSPRIWRRLMFLDVR